jgi:phosphohistidine swiveling domain-containing protein
VFTGTGRAFNSTFGAQYVAFNAQSQADQAGTLYIEASYDTGANYYPVVSVAASAVVNAAGVTSYVAQARVPVMGAFGAATLYRVVYKNGATAQGALRVVSSFTAG